MSVDLDRTEALIVKSIVADYTEMIKPYVSIDFKRALMYRNPIFFDLYQDSEDMYNEYLKITVKYKDKLEDARSKYYSISEQQSKELDNLFKNA